MKLTMMVTAALTAIAAMAIFAFDMPVVLALSVAPWFSLLFYRYPLLLLALFPLGNSIETCFVFQPVVVGPYLLLFMDPIYFFTIIHLCLCALLQPRKIAAVLKENVFLATFLLMVALYVVLYTPVYGQSAIGEARKSYFIFLIPLLAAVAIKKPADLRRFLLAIVWAAAGLAIIGVGTAVATGTIIRPINAQGASNLALVAFLMLIHRIYRIVLIGPILDKVLLWVFFTAAITAAHRTVWLAIGSGLLLAFCLYSTRQALIAKVKVLMVIIIMITGMGVVIALFPETGVRLENAFGGILNPQADPTASWRIEGWQQYLRRLRQDGNLLFGEGIGSYSGWDAHGKQIMISSHSAYVDMILKFGLFGLGLYSLLAFEFVRKALAARNTLGNGPIRAWLETGILTFGAAHAYGSGYSFDPTMLMFFALANSARQLSHRHSVESRASRGQHVPTYTNFAEVIPLQSPVRPRI